jgi:hypothetical protein
VTRPDYWREFFARAEHALLLLVFSSSAALFLAALWAAVSWLTDNGRGAFALLLALTYVVIAVPILLAQVAAVGDLAYLLVDVPSINVTALRTVSDNDAGGWAVRVLAGVLSTTSPFSPLSTWAWSLVVPSASAAALARMKYRAESAIMVATWRHLRKRA